MNSLSMCLSILWLYFWANYERTFGEWLRHIVDIFWTNLWKKPKGFFKEWLKGILVGFLWSNSQFAHRVHWDQSGGLFLNKLSLYPPGFLRAKWKINLQKTFNLPPLLPVSNRSSDSTDQRHVPVLSGLRGAQQTSDGIGSHWRGTSGCASLR